MKKITLALILGTAFGASRAEAAIPTQFIAKQYTEVLGRVPEKAGWQAGVNFFNSNDCNETNLKSYGREIYRSKEFSDLLYGNEAKVLIAYRGILNREPDSEGYNHYLNLLDTGTPWENVVDALFDSDEFETILTNSICTTTTGDPSYGWGSSEIISIPVDDTSCPGSCSYLGGSAHSLNLLLASSCTTVYLCQRSVTFVDASENVEIPTGKILTTYGAPDRLHYANMGRIVRTSNSSDDLIYVHPGGHLQNVWVSGQRDHADVGFVDGGLNIKMDSGTGTSVTDCKIDSPAGWSNLYAAGKDLTGVTCSSNSITGNLVTAYSSPHYFVGGIGTWADGLSIACEGANVADNYVVDASDVGIVVYANFGYTQASIVQGNIIVSAGNSAYGALVADPLCWETEPDPLKRDCPPGIYTYTRPSFSGMSFTNNLLWTGARTHFDAGIVLGSRAWAGAAANDGTGAAAIGNTLGLGTGSLKMRAHYGILVDGMASETISNNTLRIQLVSTVPTCGTPKDILIHDAEPTHATWINGIGASHGAAHACMAHP